MVLHAFVTSRIDFCNGLLYGLPDCEMTKLQRVQNAAVRLLTTSRKCDHIKYRIHFKFLLLTLKALNGMAPAYINHLINVRKDARFSLRYNSGTILLHPAEMKKTFGDRSLV